MSLQTIKKELFYGQKYDLHVHEYKHIVKSLELISDLNSTKPVWQSHNQKAERLSQCLKTVSQIIPFYMSAMYLIDEDGLDISLNQCLPRDAEDQLSNYLEQFIDDGTLGWVINQPKAIELPESHKNETHIFHIIATKNRVFGIFFGVLAGIQRVNPAFLDLISLAFGQCASHMESDDLACQIERTEQAYKVQLGQCRDELNLAKEKLQFDNDADTFWGDRSRRDIGSHLGEMNRALDLLQETELSDQQKSLLKEVIQSEHKLDNLLNLALPLSNKEQAETNPTAHQVFNISDHIDGVLQQMASQAFDKGLDIQSIVSPDIPRWLTGDVQCLQQLLRHLITNAIEYTPTGSVVVRVDRVDVPANVCMLKCAIEDTGVGMISKVKQRIQSHLSSSNSVMSDAPSNIGFGLATCKKLIHNMHGQMGMHSQFGQGSVFYFIVPFSIANKPAEMQKIPVHLTLITENKQLMEAVSAKVDGMIAGYSVSDTIKTFTQADRSAGLSVCLIDEPMLDDMSLSLLKRGYFGRQSALILLTNDALQGEAKDLTPYDGFDFMLSKPLHGQALFNRLKAVVNTHHDEAAMASLSPSILDIDPQATCKALVIETHLLSQEISSSLLKKMGCQVDIVDDGDAAFSALANVQYDVIFIDCHLAITRACKTSLQIRALEQSEGRPIARIIGMAKEVTQDLNTRCLEAGMDDLLVKPIKPGTLRKVMLKLLAAPIS